MVFYECLLQCKTTIIQLSKVTSGISSKFVNEIKTLHGLISAVKTVMLLPILFTYCMNILLKNKRFSKVCDLYLQ